MVTKIVNQPLGMGNCFAPSRKEWVAAAIGAGAGLASSLWGGIAGSNAAKEAERKQREMEARENAWYNRRYNEDYFDTAAGQNLVRRAKQMYDHTIKRAAGAKAVAGGTDASVAQAKEQANAAMGDTIANIAAADSQRKASVDNMHMQNQQRFGQMDIARENQRAANITSAAQQASNALISAGAAIEQANTRDVNLGGGSNNGVTIDKGTMEAPLKTVNTSTPMNSQHTDDDLLARYGAMTKAKIGV